MTKGLKGLGAALLALSLVLGGAADAAGAHDCPHHDGSPAAAHRDNPADHAHGPVPDAGSHGPCTCFGRCHAGEARTLPSPDPGRGLPTPPAPPVSVPAPPPLLRLAIVPFSLPWSNAPPCL
jgi:hypothetical protein